MFPLKDLAVSRTRFERPSFSLRNELSNWQYYRRDAMSMNKTEKLMAKKTSENNEME